MTKGHVRLRIGMGLVLTLLGAFAGPETAGAMEPEAARARRTPPTPVRVVNTPLPISANDPLPVVAASPLPVVVSEPIAFTANVTVPTVLAPVPLRQQQFGVSTLTDTDGFVSVNGIFNVPAGERAVIEYVSFQVIVPAGHKVVSVSLGTPSFGIGVGTNAYLVPVFLGSDRRGNDVYVGSQQVRLYFEPGSEITCHAARNSIAPGPMDLTVHVSGYTVAVP